MPSILKKLFTSTDTAARLVDIQAQAAAAADAEAKARDRYNAVRDAVALGQADLSELSKAKADLQTAEAHAALLADTCGAIDAKHAAALAAEERGRLEAKWKHVIELSDKRTAAAEAVERQARELATCLDSLAQASRELSEALPFKPTQNHDPGLLLLPQFDVSVNRELKRTGITATIKAPLGIELPTIGAVYRAAAGWIRSKRDEALGIGE